MNNFTNKAWNKDDMTYYYTLPKSIVKNIESYYHYSPGHTYRMRNRNIFPSHRMNI